MYPDDLFGKTFYITVQEGSDDFTYDQMRETFLQMLLVVDKFMISDIGWSDMLIQFDDEEKFKGAQYWLSQTDLKWRVRE
jgi:hypothetical protein